MVSDDKYNNYFYFFDSPEKVKFQSPLAPNQPGSDLNLEDFGKSFFAFALVSLIAGPEKGKSNMKLVATEKPIMPPGESIERDREKFFYTPPDAFDGGAENFNTLTSNEIATTDPLRNPAFTSVFHIDGGTGKTKYKFFRPQGNQGADYKIRYGRKSTGRQNQDRSRGETVSFAEWDNQPNQAGYYFRAIKDDAVLDAESNVIVDDLNMDRSLKAENPMFPYEDFKYSQLDFFQYSWPDNGISKEEKDEAVRKFFMTYLIYTGDSPTGAGVQAGISVDVTTRFGLPYDFQTVLKNKTDLKIFGVRNTQPKYEKVYNYYDPQYEPAVMDLINDPRNILDERSLPSIYDFLYFPAQRNAMRAFTSLPGFGSSPGLINLSNINQYLDKFSSVYAQYLGSKIQGKPRLNTQKLFEDYFHDNDGSPNIGLGPDGQDKPLPPLSPYKKGYEGLLRNRLSLTLKNITTNFGASKTLMDMKNKAIPEWISEAKTGVYFTEKSLNYFNQALENDNAFPFFVKINIPTEGLGPIAKLFSDHDLLDSINSYAASMVQPNPGDSGMRTYANFYGGLIQGDKEDTKDFNYFYDLKLQTFKLHFYTKPPKDFEPVGGSRGRDKVFYRSDLFIDTFKDAALAADKRVFIYTDRQQNLQGDLEGFAAIIEEVKGKLFTSKLKELLIQKNLLRSPKDIRNGKFAHQETLMYEIAKYSVDDLGVESYIQSMFLPATNQSNLSYYDTQIIPFKNYFYKIFVHKVIVGTRYGMSLFDEENAIVKMNVDVGDDTRVHQIRYNVEPVFQFVRVPFYNVDAVNLRLDELNYTRVEDKPPLPPQVNIVPFRNVNNKILIMLNKSTGETEAYPRPIFDEDIDTYKKIALSQDKTYGEKLTFRGDDYGGTFEVFRTENKPLYYTDIGNDETLVAYESDDSILDDIRPNTDYYYAFRYVDIHKKISNPSYVYKVRMEQPPGLPPYLKIDVMDLPEEQKKKNDKKFSAVKNVQKYILIRPNDTQNTIEYPNLNYDEDGNPIGSVFGTNVTVGNPSGPSVFGNTYKLRVTSKQTGRKIDVNFTLKDPENIINDL